jgi:hypothetical protein
MTKLRMATMPTQSFLYTVLTCAGSRWAIVERAGNKECPYRPTNDRKNAENNTKRSDQTPTEQELCAFELRIRTEAKISSARPPSSFGETRFKTTAWR